MGTYFQSIFTTYYYKLLFAILTSQTTLEDVTVASTEAARPNVHLFNVLYVNLFSVFACSHSLTTDLGVYMKCWPASCVTVIYYSKKSTLCRMEIQGY